MYSKWLWFPLPARKFTDVLWKVAISKGKWSSDHHLIDSMLNFGGVQNHFFCFQDKHLQFSIFEDFLAFRAQNTNNQHSLQKKTSSLKSTKILSAKLSQEFFQATDVEVRVPQCDGPKESSSNGDGLMTFLTLPETNSLHLKMGYPKRKIHLPTTKFQGLC